MSFPPAVLHDIYDRIGRLEQQSASTPGEQLIPNTYGIDQAGNITAPGLDLPAGTITTPPTRDRIRWIRQSDGAVIADLTAYSAFGQNEAQWSSYETPVGTFPTLAMRAIDHTGAISAQLAVLVGDVLVTVPPSSATILNSTGQSDFAQTNNLATTATAGARTLPANPAGFFTVQTMAGATVKIPYYNP